MYQRCQFVIPVPYTTKLAEHTQAFLGKPGSTEPQLAIRVKWYHEAHFRFNKLNQVFRFRFSARSRERGVFCVIFLTFTIDQAVYMSISEKILHIVCKITMPNAELFAINPNRMMMIKKCISNVHPALFYHLGNSL